MPDGYRIPEDEKPRPKAFRPDLRSDVPSDIADEGEFIRRHVTDDSPCWCGPQIAHVPALCDDPDCPRPHRHVEGDEPVERDMSITDITRYSEDTMFKVQAAITSLGYSGQPVLDLIGAMQNAGILFREHGPEPVSAFSPDLHRWADAPPPGLTLSDDGDLLNWRGENYVRQEAFVDDGLESHKWTGEPQHSESKRLDPADWPIPRYAMLDIWMSLYGAENSQKFEEFADKHGYAETWARICHMVRSGTTIRITDQEEHTHYTDRATRLCAEGDHDSAVMWDRDAERVKVREAEEKSDTIKSENVEAKMAEEPIERRLQRAWLNGFKEGVDRSSWAAVEATGRWDY